MRLALPLASRQPPAAGGVRPVRRRKRSRLVPLLSLVVVLAGLVAAGLYWRAQQTAAATPTTIPAPVTQGDLDVQIESSGQVEPNRNFEIPLAVGGQVQTVLVKAGDTVQAGQPLVRLDDHDLQAKVSQDAADLKSAQAKRAQLDQGPTAAELTEAQANLAKAQANLATVQGGATAPELAAAQADVRDAQLKLTQVQAGATAAELAAAVADVKSAQLKLDKVRAGATTAELAAAEADVKSAQLKLDKVRAGATAQELAAAEASVKSAQLKLDKLQAGPTAAELTAAADSLKAAQAKLAALQAGPTEAERRAKELAVQQAESTLAATRDSASATRQKAEYALNEADHALHNAQDSYNTLAADVLNADGTLKGDLPQGVIDNYNRTLRALQDAENGYRQAQMDLDDARKAEARQVADAQAKLDDAQQQLQELLAGATAADLASAQAGVASAQKALDDLQAPPTAADRQDAENTLLAAQNTLADLKAKPTATDLADAQNALLKAQNTLADLKAKPAAADLADAQNALLKAQNTLADLKAKPAAADLAAARTNLLKAQNTLADLKAKPTAGDLAAAQSGVAAAQSALQKLQEPPTAADLAAADATVLQAQAALTAAQDQLDQATLRAPFAGTVAAVDTEEGSLVSAGAKVVTLNDDATLHLDVKLSESDVAKVKAGQPASVTFDALPGQTITGTVTSVASAGAVNQNVVTYLVQVQLNPGKAPVKVGMSGTASIQVEHHAAVIQVPNRAIKTVGPFKTIQVLYGKDQTPVTVQVQTGATNGQFTEIVSCQNTGSQCLRAGDRVALDLPSGTTGSGGPDQGGNFTFGVGPATGPPPGGKGGGPVQIFVGP